ncbi:hypothetical protein ACFWCB_29860 [Streptomyces sp. NPDC060048]|uniref:hypothetical protein n=1 Tax=unclassified Streptomyces TaxID=2593676 RepID=UPI0036C875F7
MTPIRFPDDLVLLQSAWLCTYEELARQPAHPGTTACRRRLIQLSCAIETHPFWAGSTASRVELRRQARAHRWARAA